MATPPLFEAVRTRPGMFVGSIDEDGLQNLVLDVVANSYDQYLAGRCSRVDVHISSTGEVTVDDDGPGLPAAGGGGLPDLASLLTTYSDRPTVDGHRPHAHLGLGGIGLAVVNALSERFEIVTVHAGTEARGVFSRGVAVEPITTTPTSRSAGTWIRYRPDLQIFPHARVQRTELTRELEDLSFLAPGLTLTWRVDGDELARHGLRALVAVRAPCALDRVAHHHATYTTDAGPITAEVALAWRPEVPHRQTSPGIVSFCNLGRTREGTHVNGMFAGIKRVLGRKIAGRERRLVAAVAVILADVHYGNPTKDKLITPAAATAASDATYEALSAWCARFPDAADELRSWTPALTGK